MKIAARIVSFVFMLAAAACAGFVLIASGILALVGSMDESGAELTGLALMILPFCTPAIVICAMNIASYICIGKFTSAKKLRPLAIATTILGGIVPGILMLLLKDDDLKPKSEKESDSADQEQKQ